MIEVANNSNKLVMVGFNRRFAPWLSRQKGLAGHAGPLSMIYRINAGAIPSDHWTQDPEEGGGRVIGEVCHFVDLLQFFAGKARVSLCVSRRKG